MLAPLRLGLRIAGKTTSPTFSLCTRNASIMDKFKAALGINNSRSSTLASGMSLFHNARDQASKAEWHTMGLIESDFRSKQTLLMLHIWMIHRRLVLEDSGLLVQECMFDELWEDTSNRIRSHNINELSINKYLKEVQGYSFRACLELDEALTKAPDEEEVVGQIGGVLWRHAYLRREGVGDDHILKFARYMRDEQRSLVDISSEAILEGRIEWGPLPVWDADKQRVKRGAKASKGASTNSNSNSNSTVRAAPSTAATASSSDGDSDSDGDSSSEEEWKEATAPDGKAYFWNTRTRETRWVDPRKNNT